MRARPLNPPTTKYHGIYTILWKYMTRFPILHILANFLIPFAFQLHWNRQNGQNRPILTILNLRSKSARFSAHPIRWHLRQAVFDSNSIYFNQVKNVHCPLPAASQDGSLLKLATRLTDILESFFFFIKKSTAAGTAAPWMGSLFRLCYILRFLTLHTRILFQQKIMFKFSLDKTFTNFSCGII